MEPRHGEVLQNERLKAVVYLSLNYDIEIENLQIKGTGQTRRLTEQRLRRHIINFK
jgi:hypothetical protein